MSELDRASPWGILGLAGTVSVCCLGTAALAGGNAAGVTATAGPISDFGGVLVTGLATALPLFVTGLVLRRKVSTV